MKKILRPTRRRVASMGNSMIRIVHVLDGTRFERSGWIQASFEHGINDRSTWL